eukprot:491551-Hanusia_phi.AAC.2
MSRVLSTVCKVVARSGQEHERANQPGLGFAERNEPPTLPRNDGQIETVFHAALLAGHAEVARAQLQLSCSWGNEASSAHTHHRLCRSLPGRGEGGGKDRLTNVEEVLLVVSGM